MFVFGVRKRPTNHHTRFEFATSRIEILRSPTRGPETRPQIHQTQGRKAVQRHRRASGRARDLQPVVVACSIAGSSHGARGFANGFTCDFKKVSKGGLQKVFHKLVLRYVVVLLGFEKGLVIAFSLVFRATLGGCKRVV